MTPSQLLQSLLTNDQHLPPAAGRIGDEPLVGEPQRLDPELSKCSISGDVALAFSRTTVVAASVELDVEQRLLVEEVEVQSAPADLDAPLPRERGELGTDEYLASIRGRIADRPAR